MQERKYIFVVVSATPSFTGGMIRTLTGSRYNHMAISFTSDLRRMYSFARRYKSTPFCGGFVNESPRRYVKGDRVAKIKVYRIPVSDTEYDGALDKCRRLEALGERSVYNNFSAVMSLVRIRVKIKDAYTCVEFITDILSDIKATQKISKKKWYSINRLMLYLDKYKIYSGTFPIEHAVWGDDRYADKISFLDIICEELMSNGRLLYNAMKIGTENERREQDG